jgi:hypothetical protein
MSVVNNTLLLAGDDGYRIERSLRFRSSASAYLNRTPSTAGNRKTWTWSAWLKRGTATTRTFLFSGGDGTTNGNNFGLELSGSTAISDVIYVYDANTTLLTTSQVFRDYSAFYHIVLTLDTTQATASNRLKLYVNGTQVTAFSTASYPSQNADLGVNTNTLHCIGASAYNNSPALFLDGYLTEINFVDGQALTPSSFGEYNEDTGVWQPKKYAGTYGTNGFYLNFSDNASTTTLGDDLSGNGNDWTTNNISLTAGATYDSMIDTPTPYADGGNGRGNYAVLNPLDSFASGLSSGNLNFANGSGEGYKGISTFAIEDITSSQKYYIEYASDVSYLTGIVTTANSGSASNGSYSDIRGYYSNGNKYSGTTVTAYGASFTNSDQLAMLIGNGEIEFFKNNVSQGVAFTGLTGAWKVCTVAFGSAGVGVSFNFGQRPFAYTPPTGFKALNTQNLPEPVIAQGNKHFNTVLYTGNGSTQSITGVGFQPDFLWTKSRSVSGTHALYDVLRVPPNVLYSNATNSEESLSSYVNQFDADGFTTGGANLSNQSGQSFVAWNWKANGAGVSNTDGSITSTVSANPTAGFSIVTYTGNGSLQQTVGHGLGAAPKMVIVKNRDEADATFDHWWVYHAGTSNPPNRALKLNGTDAELSSTVYWWNNPTSTVFGLANTSDARYINDNTRDYIAYCFSEVAGYSRFGSYTGNGSADGPFVFCGFRPKFLLVKNTDAVTNWFVYDSIRDTYNMVGNFLRANTSDAEGTFAAIDFLSNGFKLRDSSANNSSGQKHIFMAFAESPFRNSLAR